MRRSLLLWLPALLLVSCATGPKAPLDALANAARASAEGGGTGHQRALAAWHAWFVDGDASRMEALADAALAGSPGNPWARLALAESARRTLDPEAEVAQLAELIRGAPAHPLAAVAADRLESLATLSTSLDRQIVAKSTALLDVRGLGGEAAAGLRAAIRRAHGEGGAEAAIQAAGAMTAASLAGPFSAWHHLDRRTPFPPEGPGPVSASYPGPGGAPLSLRPFTLPAGAIALGPEERDGDVYHALSVATVPAAGRHVLSLNTARSTSAAVFVDGVEILRREAVGSPQPTEMRAELDVAAGAHLVAVRIVKGSGGGDATIAIAPADGSAAAISYRAAREGDRAGTPPRIVGGPRFLSARALASALEPEVGILAAYVAASDSQGKDREGAKALVEDALRVVPKSPPLLQLRAEIGRSDEGIPQAIGQARAASDLEAVLARDPANPRALWSAAAILRDAGRHDEALDKLAAAEGHAKVSATLALAKARVALARGFDVQAWQHAREAVELDAGSCHAGTILFDLARRTDAAGEMEDAAQRFAGCPGGRARLAGLLASRGHDDEALRAFRELAAEDPQDPSVALRVSERLLAGGDAAGAAAVIARLEEAWPRSPFLPLRRAELLERAGDPEGAKAARERSLALDGSDLALRRMDAFRAGRDLLAKYDRDGLEVIREFESGRRSFDTATVTVYDFAAVEVFPDGSFVERVHVISKVLDKRGVDRLGEAHVPGAAEVIHLRTIKKDGTILEPESIAGKESVSLPNLDVGDYVEMEWLLATPSRGAGMPGWSASPFFFRTEGTPLVESVYVTRAPRGMVLDSHNGAPGPEVLEDGDYVTLRVISRDNVAFTAEPASVRGDEFLPWVQAGAGADETQLAWLYADGLAQATFRTSEVAAWARSIAGAAGRSADRKALVRAVYDRAMEEIEGSDSSVGSSASRVLAQKRGNRTLLIKAALDELGIPSRWAVVKTYDQSPAAVRFPRASRWGYLALVVRPDPQGGQIWLDPTVRWAPFGRLSPIAEGSPAMILPESGVDRPQETGTPGGSDLPRGRVVEVRLALGADGTLTGEGTERYLGFDAAWARGSLEQLDDERRRQAVESSLAKGFRGLTLDELGIDPPDESSLTLRYRFTVADAAQDLGQGMRSLDLDFFAANLGRRFLARGDRETPLFLRAPERVETRVQLELPPGVRVVGGPDAAREAGRFGDYKRSVAASPGKFALEETLELARGRVRPHEYREFARWVLAVDRAQSADLVLAGQELPQASR